MGRAKEEWIESQEYADRYGFYPMDKGKKFVCADHFSDCYARKYGGDCGKNGTCSYCGKQTVVIDMADMTKWVAGKILHYYRNPDNDDLPLAKSYYDDDEEKIPGLKRVGLYVTLDDAEIYDSTEDLLYDHNLSKDGKVIDDIASHIANDNWINNDSCVIPKDKELSISWNSFANMVKHQRRYTFFFSRSFMKDKERPTDNGLDDILTEINSIIAQCHLIETLPIGTTLYRCRKIKTKDEVRNFEDITSAPNDRAAQCRMSPAGISMFYAAFDAKVAQAEAVSDEKENLVATRIFKTRKVLHVVNLVDLPKVSIWSDNDYESMLFINKFSHEIAQPVKDNAIHYDYVPTQVFTEYLRYMLKTSDGKPIDGLIYKSCKCPNECNIVLFCNQAESKEFVEIKEINYKG